MTDISPSSQRHNSYTTFPRSVRPSSIEKVQNSSVHPFFWTNRQNFWTPEQFSSAAKESTLVY
jgi:hypothetical protein